MKKLKNPKIMKRFMQAVKDAKKNNHLLVYCKSAQDYFVLSHVMYIEEDEIIIHQF